MPANPTQLYIFNQAAESPNTNRDDELSVVREILDENGFSISDSSFDSTIVSEVFTSGDENMTRVDAVENDLQQHYEKREIMRYREESDQASGDIPYAIWIDIQKTDAEQKRSTDAVEQNNRSKLDREWDTERDQDNASHDDELTTTIDWKHKDPEDVVDDTETTQAQSESEWSAWYPCPECGSTKLLERIEEVLTVTVNEDGEIIKEVSEGEEIYFKCAECGEELLNEW